MPRPLLSTMVAAVLAAAGAAEERSFDIVVYGGSSAGVTAALQAAAMGKRVALVHPGKHVGGLTGSGLGWVDVGEPATVGGLAHAYFHRVWAHYQRPEAWIHETQKKLPGQHRPLPEGEQTMWILEPSVAERLFDEMLQASTVTQYRDEWLDRGGDGVRVSGQRLTAFRTLAGHTYAAQAFVDATYEGDLMAAAGVSYTVAREANAQYGETLNGIRYSDKIRQLLGVDIDPFVVPGDPASGLLPRINPMPGAAGDAHRGVQAYNYRMCLTNKAGNRVMIERPEAYDERQYELLFRAVAAGLPKDHLLKLSRMPNAKTDTNNAGTFSTDYQGMSWEYPEADYATRRRIAQAHELWQRGFVWSLQHHPRIPEQIRTHYAGWGLAKDEFADNGHWPYELYVREARRMVGDYVVTERTALGKEPAVADPVAYGSYHLDSHSVQYVADGGRLLLEGSFFVGVPRPFGISYRAITPKRSECGNLLVPICASASHAAFGSLRMEPVFMVLGQVAATAAVLAIDDGTGVQDVPYDRLRERLVADGLVIRR